MNRSQFRVLVADDDEITREMLAAILHAEGYPVHAARDGLEAIRILRAEETALVLTDYLMPGCDGIEVLKAAIRHNPKVAVVLVTAYGSLETILETIKEGAYGYLTKPFSAQEVRFVAQKAFERAVLINENTELLGQLRDTYRDIEIIKAVGASRNPEVTIVWLERLDAMTTRGVISPQEAAILKERLMAG